jgi:hypothetical protein
MQGRDLRLHTWVDVRILVASGPLAGEVVCGDADSTNEAIV